MNDLEYLFYEGQHRVSNKWKHYLPVYDSLFAPFRGTDVSILEIGVYRGGSLQLWKAYFGAQASVFGIDNNPECLASEEEQIRVFIGSQSDRTFLANAASTMVSSAGAPNIIIDDGGHTMEMQHTAFDVLYPLLSPGGIYVCEDTHTSYWPEFGGGFRAETSFIEYSKSLVDKLNAPTAFGSDDANGAYPAWRDRQVTPDFKPDNAFAMATESIQYFDSLVVFRKVKQPKDPADYRRFVNAGQ